MCGNIKENLTKIKEQIGNNNVKIIAVTKYANQEQVLEAYKLGISDFGESYVQDAVGKIEKFSSQHVFESQEFKNPIKWHFIGRLQKNKVKHVVGNFCLIHSIDSVELVNLTNQIAERKGVIQDILLQANISGELSKAGFSVDDLKKSFSKINELSNIRILGLMTIAPNISNELTIQNHFEQLFSLKDELNNKNMTNLKELSMGMTNDYKIAIKCGSTMLRIGRALFKRDEGG